MTSKMIAKNNNLLNPIELAQKLIRCQSVTPDDAGAIGVVEDALRSMGFERHHLTFGNISNLYARLGTGSPNLCFAGHTDVVPVGDENTWDYPPFAAEINNGILVGRGAVDMKSAIAAWISAVSEFISINPEFGGSISLLITGDEEAEAINGTVKVLEWLKARGEKIDGCIIGEPTNHEKIGEMLKIGRRGSLSFTLTVSGTQGHVAYPQFADNPVTNIIKILHNLVLLKLDNGTEHFQPSNLEITTVDVGNMATNVIPASATAKFNIRYNNTHTKDTLIKLIDKQCSIITSRYTLKHHHGGEVFITKPDSLTKTFSEAIKAVTGITPEHSTSGGTSDARFIKDICPVMEFGLTDKTAHKINEQIAISDIYTLTRIYKQALLGYFGR